MHLTAVLAILAFACIGSKAAPAGREAREAGQQGSGKFHTAPMRTVPVPRHSFEPRTTVQAAFIADLEPERNPIGGNTPAVMVADCQFKTKMPTINLDNFVQVQRIGCSSEQVTVTFDSDASAAKAAEEWGKAKNLSFMIGREWRCNNDQDAEAMRLVSKVSKGTDAKTLVFAAAPVSRNDVIAEFDISIHQHEQRREGISTSWDKGNSKTWDLGINYNKGTQSANIRELSLFANAQVGAKCLDCYSYGEATLSLRVTGTALEVKTYAIDVAGHLKANMDLLLTAYKTARADLVSFDLFSVNLGGVSVPGLFELGPTLRLKAAISYDLGRDLQVQTGFNAQLPFRWSVSSTNGLFAQPKVSAEGTPTFTPRVPQLSNEFQVAIAGHLIPEIALGLSILKISAIDLRLSLDNALGVQLSRGSLASCPAGSMNLLVFHEHELEFGVKTVGYNKSWDLWKSGRRALPCPNNACNRCIGGAKEATPLMPQPGSVSA
ncbi:hypothetical protein BCR44DRAFT_1458637 [Catenaria anguillulae PL171]|uniref:DUF7029 domain-containing protein n=1 Tax=Catenaria anguillulae PL171 TaxID=765915 RepID=A0A1Y2HXE6_9FUNG|nr:hypothetical protein BCR44DRAFT_1458637 [Catenaria anguillulae PL171]